MNNSAASGSYLSEERHQGNLGRLCLGAAVVDLVDDQEHLHQAQHAGHQSIQLHLHLQRIKLDGVKGEKDIKCSYK